jgi:hypothetical protein
LPLHLWRLMEEDGGIASITLNFDTGWVWVIRLERFGEELYLIFLQGFKSRIIGPVMWSRYWQNHPGQDYSEIILMHQKAYTFYQKLMQEPLPTYTRA